MPAFLLSYEEKKQESFYLYACIPGFRDSDRASFSLLTCSLVWYKLLIQVIFYQRKLSNG